ncbi:hypothetical protein K443DRAFT_660594 [Laccaria amethystina LaAM-08-1]|uniref:LYC1 C-terminal domain-containing protein n=1 Tax=Laccaria amethystina LaAM-08-1 TaxID=1095629 RepID=A0A0C9X9F3_9AGAR|nr:hypothetical protein K443DRAFT_660594 [Laccaria amethystina LaAM-08-1]
MSTVFQIPLPFPFANMLDRQDSCIGRDMRHTMRLLQREFYRSCIRESGSLIPSAVRLVGTSKPLQKLLITEQDFLDIGRKDADLLQDYLEAWSRQGLKPRQFAVLPTGDEFAWRVARSKFCGKILSDKPLPDYWGVRVVDDLTNATENFAIWFFDYVKKELHFLRIWCRDANVFKVITHAAAIAAKAQGCGRILAWNVDEGLLSACPQGGRVTQLRMKNLAAVAWYGEGDCPEWVVNEKYDWC